ncbi:hypothetical protein H0H87_009444 [Tephrocybe sp. NHM501043]|nr:hypothetical protein H0H87_009444 [Tephrocybe sp. NHM501043]
MHLHINQASDRAAVLDAMQGADMKLLRVFITRVAAGAKGSSANAVNDLETVSGMLRGLQLSERSSNNIFSQLGLTMIQSSHKSTF